MNIKSQDYFSIFGLTREATDLEVLEAYQKLNNEFDRQKFVSYISNEAEAKLEEICTRIIRAYETLKTQDGRQEYIRSLTEESEGKEKHPLRAEEFLQKGMKFVRDRDYPNAQKMFEQAAKLKPDEPSYLAYLGWTIYCNTEVEPKVRVEEAKRTLLEAINYNPRMDAARVFMGKILKEQGETNAALEQFREALLANPRCKEAERELTAYNAGNWK